MTHAKRCGVGGYAVSVNTESVGGVSSSKSTAGERERNGGDVPEYPGVVESPTVIRPERRLDWLQSSLPSCPR